MFGNLNKWEKLGRIIAPDKKIWWMTTYAGPSFARQISDDGLFTIYITGRDNKNRSHIGVLRLKMFAPFKILDITKDPVFTLGDLGAFDENGVSYPYLVDWNGNIFMLYAGWMPTVLTPFINGVGLAILNEDGTFTRVSKAPILPRNNDDYLSLGSSCALIENNFWRLYYTSFLKWGRNPEEAKHYYVIKYAESMNGIDWIRKNHVCINIKYKNEFSIGRPTVIKHNNIYHMWFSYRGKFYRIGYAFSKDGINWERNDDIANIDISESGWDSESICYSHVFKFNGSLYMLYNGNHYGKEGLGIAKLKLD
jgi:hypothetical protein